MGFRARSDYGASEKWVGQAHFSKDPETFRARNVVLSSSASKNGEVYTPETSRMKGASVHIKNM